MRIESSSLNLQSKNSAYSRYEKTEELQIGRRQTDASGQQRSSTLTLTNKEVHEKSFLATYESFSQHNKSSALRDEADKLAQALNQNRQSTPTSSTGNTDSSTLFDLPLKDKLKLRLILELLHRFEQDPELMKALGLDDLNEVSGQNPQAAIPTREAAPPPAANPNGTEINYSVHERFYQAETAQFSAAGQIKTADGKTIDINIELKMSREVLETHDFSARIAIATKDPLVLNFDGSAAELSDKRFSFDLTTDGKKELIPQLAGNRAFLALDKNKDAIINDGSELFGAQTGNGFAELAQYDDDKNGWIDENDAVFNDLMLWQNAGTDKQKLVELKAAGIGALYTGNAKTSFHVQDKNDAQENLGVIQATGLFLKEDGGVGTIQHIDLAI